MVKHKGARLRRLVKRITGKPYAPISKTAQLSFCRRDGTLIAEGLVQTGTTLLEVAEVLGVDLDHFCGGQCSCGTCRIEVTNGPENLSKPSPKETLVLGPIAASRGDRLACQARVMGDAQITVPKWF